MHPSWRDLVIDELAADQSARAAFLARCGPDGLLLALSSAGGTAGERALPLLHTDADWDVLAQRLHELAPTLGDEVLTALADALRGAIYGTPDARDRAEGQAVAAQLRDALTRRDRLTPSLAATWFALDGLAAAGASPPSLAGLLFEYEPGPDTELSTGAACERFDEWLLVAELAFRHGVAVCSQDEFVKQHHHWVDRLLGRADLRQPACASAQFRLERLGFATMAPVITTPLWSGPPAGGRRAERRAATRTDFVDRVLRDL